METGSMNVNHAVRANRPAAAPKSLGAARRKTRKHAAPAVGRREPDPPEERARRIFLRGTNLLPPGSKVQPCLLGTKQAVLVDMLSRPEGATMGELQHALRGGRRPWTEATVRSAFGWDLKLKGYGVRSEFDAAGVERFHLLVPKGQHIPAHTPPGKAKKRRKAKK